MYQPLVREMLQLLPEVYSLRFLITFLEYRGLISLFNTFSGCFWGIELAFQRVPGVVETEVGYCQGLKKNPTYEEVCSGSTGHAEAVRVTYDTTAIRYEDLLTVFWDIIDPTAINRQG